VGWVGIFLIKYIVFVTSKHLIDHCWIYLYIQNDVCLKSCYSE